MIMQSYSVWSIELEKALEANGNFSIKNIGDINADNNIVFKPFDQTNYLSSSFGLTAFVSPVEEKTLNKK
jgi:hypothetical protein